MARKRGKAACFLAFIFILFFTGQLTAQMNPITRFKNVSLPFALRIGDSILPKGEYDLEFLRVPNPKAYYLRIMKKGKILHLVQGEDFPYDNRSVIPRAPKLSMSRDTSTKSLIMVMESGSYSKPYAKLRARYVIQYEETSE